MRFARAALLTHEGCTPKREASSSAVSKRAVSVLASEPGAVVVPTIPSCRTDRHFPPVPIAQPSHPPVSGGVPIALSF